MRATTAGLSGTTTAGMNTQDITRFGQAALVRHGVDTLGYAVRVPQLPEVNSFVGNH
jgi:hypothetical protein